MKMTFYLISKFLMSYLTRNTLSCFISRAYQCPSRLIWWRTLCLFHHSISGTNTSCTLSNHCGFLSSCASFSRIKPFFIWHIKKREKTRCESASLLCAHKGSNWFSSSFFVPGAGESVRTDLMIDPRSKSLVLNGKPGHLQFYSLQRDKLLYNVSTLLYKLSLRYHT